MRQMIYILLIIGCAMWFGTQSLWAQGVVAGRLTDSDSGQPLQGTHIFLSGTKIGTQTDATGRYMMRDIPPGFYRLVISRIGYGRKTYGLQMGDGDHKLIDLSLKPVVYQMDDLNVDHLDDKWRKNYKYFEELFLGYSKGAEETVILNPEVLRFESNFWGRLTAKAIAPLQIVNKSLGYQVTYYLNEFKHTGERTFWDGEPLFTEMTPRDSLQQAEWEANRREAFYGSMRHFWLAMLDDRLEEEGFLLYNVRESRQPGFSDHRRPVNVDRLVEEGERAYLHEVQYSGFLEIIYTREPEDRRYLKWATELKRGPIKSQVSWLELNDRSITVDADGEVVQPYGVTQLGYFGFHRLADLTPRDYRPERY